MDFNFEKQLKAIQETATGSYKAGYEQGFKEGYEQHKKEIQEIEEGMKASS